MRRSFSQTALAIAVIVAILLTSAPVAAAASYAPIIAQDGDGAFRQFAATAATKIPHLGAGLPSRASSRTRWDRPSPSGPLTTSWAPYYQTSATTMRLSAHAAVFVETGLSIAPSVLDNIVTNWETKIYPSDRANFGSEPSPGIDGDARVTILLLNIRDGQYHGAGSYTTGYFSSVNEVPPK